MITLQYCSSFCHTLTWISHGCTCVPHPESPSHLPPHPIPQGHPSTPAPSTLSHASTLDWRSISHRVIYMFQGYSLKSSQPRLLPQSPKLCSLHLCLFCSLAHRLIVTIFLNSIYMYSDQISHSVVSDSLRPHESQHARPPCPSPSPGVHSDSHPSSQWCHWAISSSVVPFSSCPQSLPASESFPMTQLFAWGGQITGVSALASFLPKNTQGWSPSEETGWISLQSKGLSRVFSNTTVQKHQFFGAQPSSQSNSHSRTWSQEKP